MPDLNIFPCQFSNIRLSNKPTTMPALGDHQKECNVLEAILRIKEKHFPSDHPEVAMTLNNLGSAYGSLGDHSKERELLERVLKIEEEYYGSDHPDVAATLNNLGNAY